jgi:hypothetical protein
MGNRRKNEFLEERRPLFFAHAQLTAGLGIPFFTAEREGRLDNVRYQSLAGLAADNTNNFALTVRRSGSKDVLAFTGFTFTAEADDEKLTKVAHGLQTGDGPVRISNSGGALPAGLAADTDYWVIKVDADALYLAASRAAAFAGTNLTFTTDGTGTHTLAATASTRRPAVVASGVNTGAGGAALPAHTPVGLTVIAGAALDVGDELLFVATEGGAATLPLGYLHGEAVYTG